MRRVILLVFVEILWGLGAGMAAELQVPSQYQTLQSAIDAAINGDTILVAGGIHSGSGNRDIIIESKSLTILSARGSRLTFVNLGATSSDPHRWLRIAELSSRRVSLSGDSAFTPGLQMTASEAQLQLRILRSKLTVAYFAGTKLIGVESSKFDTVQFAV